ncbi:hypothetical protein C8R43DRAFT_1197909 [Mycena crocata]|nr:hypothetical protein C8R43DRAFT_1197909 [Mycena crocata]
MPASRPDVVPVASLPPEIISKIFGHCLPCHPFNTAPSPNDAPLLTAQISAQWRNIALATPALWTHMDIDTDDDSEEESAVGILKLWSSRAGGLPLTYLFGSSNPQLARRLIDAVMPFYQQWGHVNLGIPAAAFPSLRRLADHELPALVCLKLYAPWKRGEEEGDWILSAAVPSEPIIIRHAPRLREVQLLNIPLRYVHIPWEHLETLEICDTGTDEEELSLLRRCTNLQSLTLSHTNEVPGQVMHPNPVVLPSIRSLDCLHFSRLLQSVALPNLHHLEFSPITSFQRIRDLTIFLSRCAPQSFSTYVASSMFLVLTLSAIPFVTNLNIACPGLCHTFAAALEVPGMLPRLEVLSMRFDEKQVWGVNQLVGILRARREVGSGHAVLQSFTILLLNLVELDCAPFRSLAAEDTGLKICIRKDFPPQIVFEG